MSLKRTVQYWRIGFITISIMMLLSVSGCSDTHLEDEQVVESEIAVQDQQQNVKDNEDEIIEICSQLYKKASEENKIADLEMIRIIVNQFGENGYPAVDSRNQIDMTEAEQVEWFCEMVDTQEEAEITIIEVSYLGGFVKYDLETKDGNVDVVRSYYKYENGNMKREVTGSYQAEYWNYTEDGYLMFSGVWFSEELYVLELSGAEEHTALRVQPLDETYRELNRKYLLPIGFEQNNMFIADWSEDDFESVIMTYFNIDSETLQSKTIYNAEDETYEYKPRGFEEAEYPEYPYSEVVGFTENSDGTLTLTANVVFPYTGDSKVYAHEVVVRPLENGGVQYVSNRIIPSEDNYRETWHTPRLTAEEWEEKEAADDCKKMMGLIFDIYKDADKGTASNVVLNDETVLEMQKKLMETGRPVSASVTYSNMENYESVDRFLEACADGKSGSVVIYEIYDDGGIGRMKFIFDGTEMYVANARGIWNDNNKPGMSCFSYTRIKEWKYTEKGWFGYELCVPEPPEVSEIMDRSCLIRIKPMTEEQREMSERLVLGLGYQGQNLLCSNWNTENMSDLDYNGMFEHLYGMKYGEKFNSEDYPNGIPKEEFESLIMEYLPVTAEQIREYAAFDEKNQTYYWERLGCFNYAPTFFGTSLPEVVGIKENKDGTVTLTVEAVCDTVICNDAVITHELTVRFAEDGSFQYLGNEILNDGITSIPNYKYRIRKE